MPGAPSNGAKWVVVNFRVVGAREPLRVIWRRAQAAQTRTRTQKQGGRAATAAHSEPRTAPGYPAALRRLHQSCATHPTPARRAQVPRGSRTVTVQLRQHHTHVIFILFRLLLLRLLLFCFILTNSQTRWCCQRGPRAPLPGQKFYRTSSTASSSDSTIAALRYVSFSTLLYSFVRSARCFARRLYRCGRNHCAA